MNEMKEVNKVNRALGAQNKGGSSNEIQLYIRNKKLDGILVTDQ